ncbi:PPC domain-containing protein [Isosphaeraceae bacterium EP7]
MRRASFGTILAAASLIAVARAQAPVGIAPVLTTILPPGATRGATLDWILSGRGLPKAEDARLIISGEGIEVTSIEPAGEGTLKASIRVAVGAKLGVRDVRILGPEGLSNLLPIVVDTLPQVAEVEPNDSIEGATPIDPESVATGTIRARDVDHFRVRATAGTRLTFEVQAQRVGSPITPLLTLLGPGGVAVAQAREGRGGDRDCRLSFVFPDDRPYFVQLRDNTYGGGDGVAYRLRITRAPFSTAAFPLGGPGGKPLIVEVSGGSLSEPATATVDLPDDPGALVDPGSIEVPGGTTTIPRRLVVGDGPEIVEPTGLDGKSPPVPLVPGTTANGRIGRAGEVDRYSLSMLKGARARVSLRADDLGSWLDSVLFVRGPKGTVVAENDDAGPGSQNRGGAFFGIGTGDTDSRLAFEADADGDYIIEVADRYGDGGPEYAYRLSVEDDRPDFEVTLLIGRTGNGRAADPAKAANVPHRPGAFGVFNLRPGSQTPLNFLVVARGRPGPVEVRAEGLPPGVTAAPSRVDLPRPLKTRGPMATAAIPVGGSIVLKVANDARPGWSDVRIVATAHPDPRTTLRRVATATLTLDASDIQGSSRPVVRVVREIPLNVLGPTSDK